MLLQVDDKPAYADPSCAITWSSGVRTDVKADVNLKTLIGRGSGEMFQIAFSGSGLGVDPAVGGPGGGDGERIGRRLEPRQPRRRARRDLPQS
jgi:hypothetical protein